MPDDRIQVTVVMPGGTATVSYADGRETMRVCLGYLHAPDDGLIAEMREGRPKTPWASAELRDETLWAVEMVDDLEDAERRRLMQWVRETPYFEDA